MFKDKKLVILDRDGVINQDSAEYIKSPEEWIAIPGSLEAIAALNKAGYKVVIATNQSGLGRGYFSHATLEAMHQKMTQELHEVGGRIDGIFICPHRPEQDCECRKPEPGLLLDIQKGFEISLEDAVLIGDAERDIKAALSVNCDAVLVKTGKGKLTLDMYNVPENVSVFENLSEAVNKLFVN